MRNIILQHVPSSANACHSACFQGAQQCWRYERNCRVLPGCLSLQAQQCWRYERLVCDNLSLKPCYTGWGFGSHESYNLKATTSWRFQGNREILTAVHAPEEGGVVCVNTEVVKDKQFQCIFFSSSGHI